MFDDRYHEHLGCFDALYKSRDNIVEMGHALGNAVKTNSKILICGNGGSAADAQHFAAEIVGRFQKERKAYPAIALSTDTSILTAIANDYGYDGVFARQVEGLGSEGDCLVGISTSGNSKNILDAINKAKTIPMKTFALLGNNGGKLKDQADMAVIVPSGVTARVQEAHIFILHLWAEIIEDMVMEG